MYTGTEKAMGFYSMPCFDDNDEVLYKPLTEFRDRFMKRKKCLRLKIDMSFIIYEKVCCRYENVTGKTRTAPPEDIY